MKWKDLRPGDVVRVTCEDYAQIFEGDPLDFEPLFEVVGMIHAITQRKMVVDGVWRWVGHVEDCTPDDPEETTGRFSVPRKGVEALIRLDHAEGVEV